jgi:hypothetical protein
VIAHLTVRVLLLPAASAIVIKALEISTEVDTLVAVAHAALHVLQIRIDLYALGELVRLDVDKSGAHGTHEILLMREGDTARADRILELVDVDARVNHTAEELVHDVRQVARCHRAVQVAHEHRLLRIKVLRGAQSEVVVGQDPRNDLDLFVAHAARRDLEEVLDTIASVLVVLDTVADQTAHRVLALVDDVGKARAHALLGRVRVAVVAVLLVVIVGLTAHRATTILRRLIIILLLVLMLHHVVSSFLKSNFMNFFLKFQKLFACFTCLCWSTRRGRVQTRQTP